MDILQAAMVKAALKGEISLNELKVLNALRNTPKDFLELSQETGLELMELKETLSEFSKKQMVKETGGKYSADMLLVVEKIITETETAKELA